MMGTVGSCSHKKEEGQGRCEHVKICKIYVLFLKKLHLFMHTLQHFVSVSFITIGVEVLKKERRHLNIKVQFGGLIWSSTFISFFLSLEEDETQKLSSSPWQEQRGKDEEFEFGW